MPSSILEVGGKDVNKVPTRLQFLNDLNMETPIIKSQERVLKDSKQSRSLVELHTNR